MAAVTSNCGRLVTIEGGDGSGKTLQAERLAARLRDLGADVVEVREPGGTPQGEALRGVLMDPPAGGWTGLSEAMLFTVARVELAARVIQPALERGAVVVCDRYLDSTQAYQGYAGGLGFDTVARLAELARVPEPDLTFILDVPAEIGLTRAVRRRRSSQGDVDHYETLPASYHEEVRRGFLAVADRRADRCRVIDASAEPDAVSAAIWETVVQELVLPAQTLVVSTTTGDACP